MSPLIAVAGGGSHSGKTSLCCALITELLPRRVAALKIATATPDHRCERTGHACTCLAFEGTARLLTDRSYVDRPTKDTGRYLLAGAEPVWWLQTTRDSTAVATEDALARLAALTIDVTLVEGAEPLRQRRADLGIFVVRGDGRPPKPGFSEVVRGAHIVVVTTMPGVAEDRSALTELLACAPQVPIVSWTVGAPVPLALAPMVSSLVRDVGRA